MNGIIEEFKNLANLIVGEWHSEKLQETVTFSFSNKLREPARLIIETPEKTATQTYSLFINRDSKWCFDIDHNGEYCITEINTKEMIITDMKSGIIIRYFRRINRDFVNEILTGLY